MSPAKMKALIPEESPQMKIRLRISTPRLFESTLAFDAVSILQLIDGEDDSLYKEWVEKMRSQTKEERVVFSELRECIRGLQNAPFKRDRNDQVMRNQQGQPIQSTFKMKEQRLNGEILDSFSEVMDKYLTQGKDIDAEGWVEVPLRANQVAHLAKIVHGRCDNFSFTGKFVVEFYDRFDDYSIEAHDLMSVKPKKTVAEKSGEGENSK